MWFINYSSPHLFSDEFYISQHTSVEFGEEFDFWISTLEFMCQLSTPRPGPDVGGKLKCHQFCKRFFFSQAKGQSESVIYAKTKEKQGHMEFYLKKTSNFRWIKINKSIWFLPEKIDITHPSKSSRSSTLPRKEWDGHQQWWVEIFSEHHSPS